MAIWQKVKSLSKDVASKAIITFLIHLLKYAIPSGFSATILAYLSKENYPFLQNLSPAAIVSVAVVLPIAIFITRRVWALSKNRAELLSNSGLFYFRKNVQEEDKSKNQELLLEKIAVAKVIEILGATGYNTFARWNPGKDKAVLREAFETYEKGEIKLLLLNPDSKQTRMRASSLGVPLDKYRKEIFESINFLKELKNKGKALSLKLYSQRPIWKMIILDNFLWLQHYDPRSHVDLMPVYGIYRKEEGDSFFGPLYEVFKKKWNHDYNPTYDFETAELVYPAHEEQPSKRVPLVQG